LLLDISEGRQSFYAGTLRPPQERHGGRSLQ
jgi:hypothetical protein